MNNKFEELLNNAKFNELFHKKQLDEEKKSYVFWFLAIIGAVASIAAISYAVYRYFTPAYLDDFDDDFYDDFDDDDEDFDDDSNCSCHNEDKE